MTNVDLTKAFREEYLKSIEHEDANKHWIGESLPSPSLGETTTSGTSTSTGDSPFPARADHSHDTNLSYTTVGYSPYVECPGGGVKTYINNLLTYAGSNMFAPSSTQLLVCPHAGFWLSNIRIMVYRTSGTFTASFYTFSIEYNNGTILRQLEETGLPVGRTAFITNCTDMGSLAGGTGNAQLSYFNGDSVSHNVFISYWNFVRLFSATPF